MSDTDRKAITIIVILSVLAMNQVVDCQFFTKSSAKSIPRMGRRSVETRTDVNLNPYRRALIDALVDEFGPDLLYMMQPASVVADKGVDYTPNEAEQAEQREIMIRNSDSGPIYRIEEGGQVGTPDQGIVRAERALATLIASNTGGSKSQRPSYKDASLALRALNTNRYLKHLSSSQPLNPYEGFMSGPSEGKVQQ